MNASLYAISHLRSCYVCVTIPQVFFLVSFAQNKKIIRLGLFLYYIWLILILYLIYSYIIFNLFLFYFWVILILYLTYSYIIFDLILYYMCLVLILYLTYSYTILDLFLYYIWLNLLLYLTYSYIIFDLFLYYIWLILANSKIVLIVDLSLYLKTNKLLSVFPFFMTNMLSFLRTRLPTISFLYVNLITSNA